MDLVKASQNQRQEKILVLSGSGFRLSYFIGHLYGATIRNVFYKHVFGISGGALIGAILCKYPIKRQAEAVRELDIKAEDYISEQALDPWPVPFPLNIWYIYFHGAVYSGEFMKTIIEKEFDDDNMDKIFKSDRDVTIVAFNCVNGIQKLRKKDLVTLVEKGELERSKAYEIFRIVLRASISATTFYPSIFLHEDLLQNNSKLLKLAGFNTDAGIASYVPIKAVYEIYGAAEEIHIVLSVARNEPVPIPKPTFIPLLLGLIPAAFNNEIQSDMAAVWHYKLNARVFQPTVEISSHFLDPDRKIAKNYRDLGEKDYDSSHLLV